MKNRMESYSKTKLNFYFWSKIPLLPLLNLNFPDSRSIRANLELQRPQIVLMHFTNFPLSDQIMR